MPRIRAPLRPSALESAGGVARSGPTRAAPEPGRDVVDEEPRHAVLEAPCVEQLFPVRAHDVEDDTPRRGARRPGGGVGRASPRPGLREPVPAGGVTAQADEADRDGEDEGLQPEGNGIGEPACTGDDEDADVLEHGAEQGGVEQDDGSSPAEQERQAAECATHDGEKADADGPERPRLVERLLLGGERREAADADRKLPTAWRPTE